jgi:hypothetical protein
MHGHRPPTLHTAMRALAVAVVLAFGLSALSISYAAGRYSTRDDSICAIHADFRQSACAGYSPVAYLSY